MAGSVERGGDWVSERAGTRTRQTTLPRGDSQLPMSGQSVRPAQPRDIERGSLWPSSSSLFKILGAMASFELFRSKLQIPSNSRRPRQPAPTRREPPACLAPFRRLVLVLAMPVGRGPCSRERGLDPRVCVCRPFAFHLVEPARSRAALGTACLYYHTMISLPTSSATQPAL